jgi:hypothetical protein
MDECVMASAIADSPMIHQMGHSQIAGRNQQIT